NATAFKIKKYLFDSGFRDADVNYTIEPAKNRKPKVNLTYIIQENTPYLIDSVIYDFGDDSLKNAVLSANTPSFVAKGLRFTNQITEAEKTRIEIIARDKGYFNFSNKYITYGATNAAGSLEQFKKDKAGTLLFQVFNPDGKAAHQKFTVEEVTFQAIEFNSVLTKAISDTVYINGIKFITNDVKIPLRVIDRRISTRPSSLYSTSEISETQRQIGLLSQFSFVSQQITQLTDSTLKIDYFAPTLNRFGFTATPGVQSLFSGNNSNFTGFVVPFSFK
ncbi:MAG: hypothetical protein NWP83_04455, partial [Spirosomaceae bacterium]|nr:hypothetical protein [Spirosomataceae bacterium]